ncbi:hypothetical protein MJO28_000362 [Puccinia striiformis f. sp. tritici]|uniref:Uncharacterized protein n=1 Tax=Puccinia striiformis f. sp. tritici TaxID=168172 RepID=A0ACC0EZK5_9BASI|nr:hypothetical protein MJO28_000362 [Puccinia striiformis f. sp. tritici]
MKPDPEPQTMNLKTAPEPETVMLQPALEHQTVALETEESPKSSIPLETAPEPPTVMLKPPLEQPTSALETAEPPKPAAELELLSSTLESRPEDSLATETTSSAFPIIPPPPEKKYDTKEAMAESIQNWACNHGFAIVVGNSDFTRGENRIKYQCDRSGHYCPHRPNKPVDPKNPVKLTKSCKINCPFSMNAVLNADNMWVLTIKNGTHNHGPSDNPSAHHMHRQMTEEVSQEISKLANAAVRPLKIQNSSKPVHIPLTAIYNKKYKDIKAAVKGKPTMETVIDALKAMEFSYMIKADGDGHLNALFFALPGSIELAKKHATMIQMDATYQTNKYKMLLLHVVGVDSSNKTFTFTFCFLAREQEEDYQWALEQLKSSLAPHIPDVILTDKEKALMNAIETVFPTTRNLLCQWHMARNLETNCAQHFSSADYKTFTELWNFLVASYSEQQYKHNLANLANHSPPEVMEYLTANWIPIKNQFVRYLINDHLHFGNLCTSRAESMHAALKRFLKGATSSLRTTISDMYDAVRHQLHEVLVSTATQKTVHINNLPEILSQLGGKISHAALKMARKTLTNPMKPRECKNCKYELYMGIPCVHKMKELEGLGVFLTREDFHPQWHLLDLPNLTPEFESPAESRPSDEDYDKVFLGEILDRFQALPTHKKPDWISRFGKLLDMTHVLKRLEEPIDQPRKGRPRGSKTKPKAPAKSTKRDPSRHEHLAPPKKRGRPAKEKDSKEAPKNTKKRKNNNKKTKGKGKKSDTDESSAKSTDGTSSDEEDLAGLEKRIGLATVAAPGIAIIVATSSARNLAESSANIKSSANTDVWCDFNKSHPNWVRVAPQARPLISSIHNVEGDGNCGFRAAAISMGQSQEEWNDIREKMATAMTTHAVYKNVKYLQTISDESSYDKLLERLTFNKSPAPPRTWITFPRHGDLLANAYQRPIIHISNLMLVTFLPLSHGPTLNPPIFLVLLEGQDHYNAFNCHGDIYPAPEISTFWYKWRSNEAKGWEAVIQKHRNEWIKRVPRRTGRSIVLNIE